MKLNIPSRLLVTAFLPIAVFIQQNVNGQTALNYVRTWYATAPETNGNDIMTRSLRDVKMETQYSDGLGRLLQTVMREGSKETGGTAIDLVNPVVYDAFGREEKKYLPFVANNTGGNTHIIDGLFKGNPLDQQLVFMQTQYNGQGESNFYIQTDYEFSPLNRPKKAMAPGINWVGNQRGVEAKIWSNTNTDAVRKWSVSNTTNQFGDYITSGIYNEGELIKEISVDEHGKQSIQISDKEGKVILKKVQLTASADNGTGSGYNGWLCTYYIYDDNGSLRCMVQPEGVKWLELNGWNLNNSTILSEQCFRYAYDYRNRMIIKKVPGSGEVFFVYDVRDRLVMKQDANLREQGKWLIIKYENSFNRSIETGLWINSTAHIDHINNAKTSNAYPQTSSGYELLTSTHYDDYNNLPPGLTDFLPNWNGNFLNTDNTNWPYPQMPQKNNKTRGLVTWYTIKVLGSSNTYLNTVIYYDNKGRTIQTQSSNITGGVDIVTTQYNWVGQALRVVYKQQNASSQNPQEHIVISKMTYDDLGRIVDVYKSVSSSINGVAVNKPESKILKQKYDKLGQLKQKILAPDFDGGLGLETLNFDYNIRGWLLGVNKDYLSNTPTQHFFGFELGYDKLSNTAGRNFLAGTNNGELNGNINGIIWKSAGDQRRRKYDYEYDAADRLLRGDFEQNDVGSSWGNSIVNYTVKLGDGVDVTTAYDANGNLKRMQQWGLKVFTSTQIDDFTYSYSQNSNKLSAVTEQGSGATAHHLGDFTDKNTSGNDYGYDKNGNLITDLNKRINGTTGMDLTSGGAITYNYLNLPEEVNIYDDNGNSKGKITYTYDATGNKLKKSIEEFAVAANNYINTVTTSTYIRETVFESKSDNDPNTNDYSDQLQLISMEEGRIRFVQSEGSTPASFEYDYFIKDHVGNVRMVITEEQRQDVYPAATLENVTYNGGTAISVEDDYYTINSGNVVNKSEATDITNYPNHNGNPPYNNNPYSNYTANSDRLYKLNATTNTMQNKTGLGIVLKVMAGDYISIFGKSYHKKPGGGYTGSTNSIAVLDLINAFAGTGIVASKGVTGSQITGQSGFPTTMTGLIGSQPAQSSDRPKAAINWIVFDEQFKYVDGGFDMVGQAGGGGGEEEGTLKTHNLSTIPAISITKNGYIYVYCSNESQYNVFFDNIQLIHDRGSILEETHYYPFGLTMTSISSKASKFGTSGNKEKTFQGQRFDDDLGLDWVQFKWRSHDSQIGRFMTMDPLASKYEYMTPLQFASNNPISMVELEGLEGIKHMERDEEGNLIRHVIQMTVYVVVVDKWDKKAANNKRPKGRVESFFHSEDVKTVQKILNSQFNGRDNRGSLNKDGELVFFDFNVQEFKINSTTTMTLEDLQILAYGELGMETGTLLKSSDPAVKDYYRKVPSNFMTAGYVSGGTAKGDNNGWLSNFDGGKQYSEENQLHEMMHQLINRAIRNGDEHSLGGALDRPTNNLSRSNVSDALEDAVPAKQPVKVVEKKGF